MFSVYTRTVSVTVTPEYSTAIGGCKSSALVSEGFLYSQTEGSGGAL